MKASEHQIQSAYIEWVNRQDEPGYSYIYACPNAGKRHVSYAVKMRDEGLRSGVPDICIPFPVHGADGVWIPGAFIEFKAGRGDTSEKQDEWIARLRKVGHCIAVAYGWEPAAAFTRLYFSGQLTAGSFETLRVR